MALKFKIGDKVRLLPGDKFAGYVFVIQKATPDYGGPGEHAYWGTIFSDGRTNTQWGAYERQLELAAITWRQFDEYVKTGIGDEQQLIKFLKTATT